MSSASSPDKAIHGMPGTGKTTTLLDIAEDELADPDVGLTDITAVTFRTSMAAEFRDRLAGRVGEELPDANWVRTTHSACYRLLGLSKDEVVDEEDRYAVCESVGIPFYEDVPEEEDDRPPWMDLSSSGGDQLGNKLFNIRSYCIQALSDPISDWRSVPTIDSDTRQTLGGSPGLVKLFNERYESYKKENGLVDFDDMLREVYDQGLCPPTDVLIEDEYQDKTPLQVEIHKQWADRADRVYVAGDPFQAIYRFMGSDPMYMAEAIDKAAEVDVLDTSYRFGPAAKSFGWGILDDAGHDVPDVEAAGETSVERISWNGYRSVLESIPEEETLHLVRANYLAENVADVLKDAGVPFDNKRSGIEWTDRMVGLFNAAGRLLGVIGDSQDRFGAPDYSRLSLNDARLLLPALPASMFQGTKRPVVDALEDLESDDELELYNWLEPASLLELAESPTPFGAMLPSKVGRSESIRDRLTEAWVRRDGAPIGDLTHRVTTIHGSKGSEADYVFLLDGSSRRIENDSDRMAEAKVWFVGATRAKQNLFVVETNEKHRHRLPPVGGGR